MYMYFLCSCVLAYNIYSSNTISYNFNLPSRSMSAYNLQYHFAKMQSKHKYRML